MNHDQNNDNNGNNNNNDDDDDKKLSPTQTTTNTNTNTKKHMYNLILFIFPLFFLILTHYYISKLFHENILLYTTNKPINLPTSIPMLPPKKVKDIKKRIYSFVNVMLHDEFGEEGGGGGGYVYNENTHEKEEKERKNLIVRQNEINALIAHYRKSRGKFYVGLLKDGIVNFTMNIPIHHFWIGDGGSDRFFVASLLIHLSMNHNESVDGEGEEGGGGDGNDASWLNVTILNLQIKGVNVSKEVIQLFKDIIFDIIYIGDEYNNGDNNNNDKENSYSSTTGSSSSLFHPTTNSPVVILDPYNNGTYMDRILYCIDTIQIKDGMMIIKPRERRRGAMLAGWKFQYNLASIKFRGGKEGVMNNENLFFRVYPSMNYTRDDDDDESYGYFRALKILPFQ